MADSPAFWKRVNFVGLGIGAAVASITVNNPVLINNKWIIALGGISAAMVALSQFAVKTTTVLENPNATLQDYTAALSELPKQFQELKEHIATTVNAIQDNKIEPAIPVEKTPVIKDPPVEQIIPAVEQIKEEQNGNNIDTATATTAPGNTIQSGAGIP